MRLIAPVLLALTLILLGAISCAQLDDAVLDEEVTETISGNQIVTLAPNGILFTNVYFLTNYYTNYSVSPVARGIAESTEMIPVYGTVISAVLTGLLGLYRGIRNRRLAEATIASVEAGRKILLSMPDGERIDGAFKNAMVEEQEFLGEKPGITKIVELKTRRTNRKRT